jgi:NAD(P)-dependent dehydrogenase (short-subunit alcohol dehydrogenase family)
MALASAGARVVLSGRNDEGLAKVLGELPAVTGGAHEVLLQDHADPAAMERAADSLVSRLGAVHVLVANTGGPAPGFLVDAQGADIEKAVRQHVGTAQGLLQAFAPGMRAAGFGRVVAVTSTSVVTPLRGLGVSNVVRAAMGNWVRTMAGELGAFGITVNMVMPGSTRTGRLQAIMQGRASRAGSTVQDIVLDSNDWRRAYVIDSTRVFVTPDALGDRWKDGKLSGALLVQVNGQDFGRADAGVDMTFDFGTLIAHLAKTRALGAGTIIGSGTVSNKDADGGPGKPVSEGGLGYSCIAEIRTVETIQTGAAKTPFLKHGDTVRIEMLDDKHHTLFGAIEQTVAAA